MYWICGISTCLVTWLIFSWMMGFFLCTVFLMILGSPLRPCSRHAERACSRPVV